ncbi:MAG: hypothetical protein NZ932_04230 [Candidatus Bathyarchaeota archaeon]|nr:hypothetical protein [Candidatus Bathyarchaeota archaeon]MDW8040463.1 hypothetical protein [Nitrososphaerota archaeon]
MHKKILTVFAVLLLTLAITGYAYTKWQETLQIQGTLNSAKVQITLQAHNTTLQVIEQTTHKLWLRGTMNSQNKTLWTGIIINNTGTTPVTITQTTQTNDTQNRFQTQTLYYGPYATVPPEKWDNSPTLPPSGGASSPPELPAQKILITWQNITMLTELIPVDTAIEITVTYTATFQSWTETITIKYTITRTIG